MTGMHSETDVYAFYAVESKPEYSTLETTKTAHSDYYVLVGSRDVMKHNFPGFLCSKLYSHIEFKHLQLVRYISGEITNGSPLI